MTTTLDIEDTRQGVLLSFWTPGEPKTAGSKTAITRGKGGVPLAKPVVVDSGNRADKRAWRGDLRDAAAAATQLEPDRWPTDDALDVLFVFVRRRPGQHLRTGRAAGVVKDWAVGARPTQRPDGLKLRRAAEDALTGILWADDSMIVDGHDTKAYGDQVGLGVRAEGCLIVVRRAGAYAGPPIIPTLGVAPTV